MFASGVNHDFCASTLSPGLPSLVVRVNTSPPTVTFVVARITVVPLVFDVITPVHEPVPPVVVQLVGPTKLPGPETIEKVITVPSGAFTKPVPGFTFT